jgi:hypothetical protein
LLWGHDHRDRAIDRADRHYFASEWHRGLNHDGVINALDTRILVTLCNHPGCVSN